MWGALDAIEDGDKTKRQRCNQLKRSEVWGDRFQKGSIMMKHDGPKESAYAIISKLVEKQAHVVLEIQTEMTNQSLSLDETGAKLQNDNAQLHLCLDQLAAQVAARNRSRLPNVEPSLATVPDSALEPSMKDLERRVRCIEHRQSTGRGLVISRAQEQMLLSTPLQ
ncbi:hypothetical protein THARTR1_03640 [Trichoderma harzianum]|uniref:Uncharacterized protein n=1 Tax=Trichoderma harzianum TaxID=5544 RepID=A0A2K0UEA6_TRIHA|nr:hypothetical protein THARTR1_03640 [Trichoderma harzianum]